MRSCARALWVLLILLFAGSASAKVKTGTYTGDGSSNRIIAGVGFAPVVVIIKGNDDDGGTGDLTSAVLRSATMPAGMTKPLLGDQSLLADLILSLDADGFTVGSNRRVNAIGIEFHYVAFDASPNLALGTYYALDAASGDVNWSLPLADGAIKGFVFPNFGTGDLFLATSTKIWSISDNGSSAAVNPGWPVTSADVPSPSTPIVIPGANVLAGGSDGRLYQIDTVSPLPPSNVVLGDGTAAVGVPSVDLLNSMVYVGTDQGVIYGVLLPLP